MFKAGSYEAMLLAVVPGVFEPATAAAAATFAGLVGSMASLSNFSL